MTVRSGIGLAVGITVLAGVLTACTSTVFGTPTRVPPSRGATAGRVPATQAHLASLVLQPADLPAAATSTPYQADPTAEANAVAFAACVGARNTKPDRVADAHSPDFTMGATQLSSQAASYRSQDDVNVDTAAWRNGKATACFKQVQRAQASQLPAGAKILNFDLTVSGPVAGDPPNLVAHGHVQAAVSESGRTTVVFVSANFLSGPLIEAEVDVTTLGAPPDSSVQGPLVDAVAARVANG